MEEHVLRWLHQQSTPALDALFRASHQLGTFAWCASLVALMVAYTCAGLVLLFSP